MNKQMIRDSLILFAITLIAGLLLGGVYAITKNPIAKTQEDKKNEAYQAVFTDAEEFTEVTDAADAQQILTDAGYTKDRIDEVKAAMDADGNILGYVMTITSSEAYGGELQLAMGIRMDGTVNGISFLSLSETIGLGMEAKKPEFQEQFAGKQVEQFVYSKTGAAADNEIDALSGATITTNAVTNAVNAGICYAGALGAGSAEQGGDTDE